MRSLLLVAGLAGVSAQGPVQKIISLLGDMQTKAIKEGEVEQANFEELQRWCEKQSDEKKRAIRTEKKQITSAKAQIETSESNMAQLSASVETLSSKISENEKELSESESMRKEQKGMFEAKDLNLVETIDTLTRAAKVLKKHLKGGNTAFLQQNNSHLDAVKMALGSIVHASFISLEDKSLIQNLLQQDNSSKLAADNADSEFDLSFAQASEGSKQPQATVSNYENKSGGLVDTFEELKDKAEAARSQAQKDEMKSVAAYNLLQQSTRDEIRALKSEMDDAKKKSSRSEETKATATGNLENVQKDLAGDQKYLEDTQRECMNSATEFETSSKARAEEVGVLAKVKEVLSKGTALVQTASSASTSTETDGDFMSAMSFLQVSMRKAHMQQISEDLKEREQNAATYLRNTGHKLQSYVLTQLGAKIGSSNPAFAKVTQMVQSMIEKLEKEIAGEADQHAWCMAETKKTDASLQLKSDRLDELKTRFEQGTSNKQQIEDQIRQLQSELASMDASQKE